MITEIDVLLWLANVNFYIGIATANAKINAMTYPSLNMQIHWCMKSGTYCVYLTGSIE